MLGALIEVSAAVVATAMLLLLPGTALIAALRAWHPIPALLRPAGAVLGSLLVAAPLLVATLALRRSIVGFAVALAAVTLALAIAGLLRWRPRKGPRPDWRGRLRDAVWHLPPALIVAAIAAIDAPHVRSDTFWHVALARRLADIKELSSAAIAFEAGADSNANYPLPVLHALIAVADHAPRVDAWSATWFLTIWMAPVAMLAFAGMAARLVGTRAASLAGSWVFATIVVLGYGPWFFATRFLSYPGQVAIYALLPLVITAIVLAIRYEGVARVQQLIIAAAATVGIGLLHGNYVLYPALFSGGGAALLLLARRDRRIAALATTATVVLAGAVTLAAQLPWITDDDNFLRGSSAPSGEPSAFLRHRDVFVGSEQSFHVELGSLATQPWLVLGALAIPVLLYLQRRRPGPWVLAGGAVAIVVFAWTPQLVELLDRAGSVTPVTRFDRVYPAAVGVVALALGLGLLLCNTWRQGRALGTAATVATFAAVATGTWWADSIRDTRRIVVTPFVEARWVGGLAPDGLPRVAVIVSTAAIVVVAVWIRLRQRIDLLDHSPEGSVRDRRGRFAALVVAAACLGLAPASIERLQEAWQPQAYRSADRDDRRFERIEVYPVDARAAILELPAGTVILGGFNDVRRIASLAPVQSVDESVLREIVADPPAAGRPARQRLDELVRQWKPDYVVASRFDRSFATMLDAAQRDPRHFSAIDAGPLRMFRVRGNG